MPPFVIFWKSVLVGFCVAAPVGPVGILVIRRSLTHGWRWAFASGLAAAFADLLYALFATRGLNQVVRLLHEHERALQIGGGLLMLFLGLKIFSTQKASPSTKKDGGTLFGDLSTAFFLMVANPATILIFLAVLATIGVRVDHRHGVALIAGGVAAGSAAWWLLLSLGASAFRTQLTEAKLKRIDQAAGGLVVAFGAIRLIQAFSSLI